MWEFLLDNGTNFSNAPMLNKLVALRNQCIEVLKKKKKKEKKKKKNWLLNNLTDFI